MSSYGISAVLKEIYAAHLELNSSIRALVIRFSLSTNWGEPNRTRPEKLLPTSKTEARMVNWYNWDCSSCSRVVSVSRVWGSREEQAIRIGRSWWKPRIQNKAMAHPVLPQGTLHFQGPREDTGSPGTAPLWGWGALGCWLSHLERSQECQGKSEVVWRALPPPASAIWWCDQGGLRWDESVFSICIPEASRLWFFSRYTYS